MVAPFGDDASTELWFGGENWFWYAPTVDRRVAALRPVIKASGWILAGAGVGSVALIALLWAITSFTSLKDTSDTWTVAKIDQQSLAR